MSFQTTLRASTKSCRKRSPDSLTAKTRIGITKKPWTANDSSDQVLVGGIEWNPPWILPATTKRKAPRKTQPLRIKNEDIAFLIKGQTKKCVVFVFLAIRFFADVHLERFIIARYLRDVLHMKVFLGMSIRLGQRQNPLQPWVETDKKKFENNMFYFNPTWGNDK